MKENKNKGVQRRLAICGILKVEIGHTVRYPNKEFDIIGCNHRRTLPLEE